MVSRRKFLTIGTGGLAAASLTAHAWAQAPAQTPKRGGTLSLRTWDPPHFDHILAHAYKTHVVISFTHSRLLKHKAGPGVRPGAFPIEGDLAESWQQTSDTTYVFKLKKGVRFHAKPPVNGRELTAEDVRYTFERILTDKGSVNVSMYRAIAKIEARRQVHRAVHAEGALRLVPRHGRQSDGGRHHRQGVRGEVRRPEEAGGGYRHRPMDARQLQAERLDHPACAIPTYFVAGLPYIDRVEMVVDEDNASRIAAFLGGKYDLGWEFPGAINRTDWVQIAEPLKKRRPNLKTLEYPSNVMNTIDMRTDKPPFNDVRVRQAISLAMDRKGMIDAVLEGSGRNQRPGARRAFGVGAAHRGARRGREVLSLRPDGGQAAPRRCRPPERLFGERVLLDLRVHACSSTNAAPAEGLEGGGHRRQAGPEGIRSLPGDVPGREIRLDGVSVR